MAVNEKCDVYSFGVLCLEIIIGKYSGDLISCLMESPAGSTIQSFLLKDVLDQWLPHPTNRVAKEVISIARIAFDCLSKDPHCRPTMQQVSDELETPTSASLDQFDFHTITLGQRQRNH